VKKLAYTLLILTIGLSTAIGQTPEGFNYQAVLRDGSGNVIAAQSVGIRISILLNAANGSSVYKESFSTTTTSIGLVNLKVGQGDIISGDFNSIDWSAGLYFIELAFDINGGTNYIVLGSSQLMSVPYALHAKTADNVNIYTGEDGIDVTGTVISETKYQVGDSAQGGIVFWLDETGEHGLVCAKLDQSASMRWFAGSNNVTMAWGDGPFSGEANTAIIIANQGYGDGGTYAARVCNELQITEKGKTYGDWYLPSIIELQQMYLNKATIDASAILNGGSGFANDDLANYWSSTETDGWEAWSWNFYYGVKDHFYPKGRDMYVRAIRAF
jgi:Protein of unknown function (DUF1566)